MHQTATQALSQAASLNNLLGFALVAHRSLSARLLALHKATAKLSYVSTAILATLTEQGFCTVPQAGEQEEQQGSSQQGSLKEGTVWLTLTMSCYAVAFAENSAGLQQRNAPLPCAIMQAARDRTKSMFV